MLHFLKHMHSSDLSRLERGRVVFGLQAIHINEAAVNELPSSPALCTPPQQLHETCERFCVKLHAVALEAVFLESAEDVPLQSSQKLHIQREQLRALLQVLLAACAYFMSC